MAKGFTLGKDERLKSRKQTELLFSEGKKFSLSPLRIHYSQVTPGKTSLLFGAGVSKRNFKKAVDRNRVKRLLRETYRLQKNSLQDKLGDQGGQLHLFIIYTGTALPQYKELYQQTGKAIQKLCKLISDQP